MDLPTRSSTLGDVMVLCAASRVGVFNSQVDFGAAERDSVTAKVKPPFLRLASIGARLECRAVFAGFVQAGLAPGNVGLASYSVRVDFVASAVHILSLQWLQTGWHGHSAPVFCEMPPN